MGYVDWKMGSAATRSTICYRHRGQSIHGSISLSILTSLLQGEPSGGPSITPSVPVDTFRLGSTTNCKEAAAKLVVDLGIVSGWLAMNSKGVMCAFSGRTLRGDLEI